MGLTLFVYPHIGGDSYYAPINLYFLGWGIWISGSTFYFCVLGSWFSVTFSSSYFYVLDSWFSVTFSTQLLCAGQLVFCHI